MAYDWIKMRHCLLDHPVVLEIAEAAGIDDTDIVVGKLFRVWVHADLHTTDGLLRGATAARVNRLVGREDFGEALLAAGWLVPVEGGLQIFKFDDHISESAKKRAEKARKEFLRYHAPAEPGQKAARKPPGNGRKSGGKPPGDGRIPAENGHQEQEQEQEEKTKTPLPPSLDTGAFRASWAEWLAYRAQIRKPLKPASVAKLLAKLARWGAAAACEAIDAAIGNGWVGLHPPKEGDRGRPGAAGPGGGLGTPPG